MRIATTSKVPIFIVCLALLNFLAYFFIALHLHSLAFIAAYFLVVAARLTPMPDRRFEG